MAISNPSQIIAVLCPQYSTSPKLTDIIALATLRTGDCFGNKKDYAIALRVCHWLALDELRGGDISNGESGTGEAGRIRKEKEHRLEREYSTGSSSSSSRLDEDLGQTRWGMDLLQLSKECLVTVRTRLSNLCD